MTLPSSDNLIGKQLSDSYGRYFGTIVGINTDESGSVCSIGVDAGCHGFQTISVNQITFMDDNPVLVSNWKFKAESLIKTSGAAQKRIQALEDLRKEGEISQAIYEQLVSRNKAQFDLCLKNCDDAVASLNEKTAVIQNEKSIIAAFFGILKLQHRMQEIDDSTYQSTSEHLDTILQRNDREANDISSILNSLTLQEPEPVQETISVEVPTTDTQMDTPVLEETIETGTDVPCEQISEALAPEIVSASEDVALTTVEETIETGTDVPCEQISEALAPEIVSASEDVALTTVEET
ncbi:MAG: CdvA-like protein, partial [Thaumarchaeota archaeon]|nr:CdvA-like protein [Nitrososphaerota archaeon]